MSFQQALSGLNAASKNLDVIGNNVANANTVGFKVSRAEFADVFASSSMGNAANSIGIGTKLNSVTQMFTQGPITVTDNPFDVAISGEGFFRMDDNGSVVYSRNGQFHPDDNGFLVNANNQRLTGYLANAEGQIVGAQPQPLRLTISSLEAKATTEVTQGSVLDSREDAIPTPVAPAAAFDPDDSETYTHATSTSIYDSLGNSHLLSTYYIKRDANTWEAYTVLDSDPALMSGPHDLVFDTSGHLDPALSDELPTIAVAAADLGTGAAALNFTYDMSSTSQTGQVYSNEVQRRDGFTSGRLSSFSIDDNGMLVANYSNQETRVQGQIVLASFVNPQGLVPAGDNNYLETTLSGGPRVGAPGSSDFGVVRSGAVEDANVDLTGELVNMITAQRVYQANAQTIKTQDSVMQTLVSLR